MPIYLYELILLSIFKKNIMQNCPVLHPTQQEFSQFNQYVHFLSDTYKKDYGMVKVVPPATWKAQSINYQEKLKHLVIKNAIEQNAQGLGGYYQVKNIVQSKMQFEAYKKYSLQESKKVDNKTVEQKQRLFWKTVTYSPPIYGADLTGTLMDGTAKQWNFNTLDSILKYAFTQKIRGVNEPYCYIGTWKAFFSWHKQDLDLSAINYIHQGAPKVWYSIAQSDSHQLEEVARERFKNQYLHCNQFLRHKTFLINPDVLIRNRKDIKISKTVHNQGEIMIVFGGAYHCGFNCGFNIAEAVNYATIDWLTKLPQTKACKCTKRSVKAQLQYILYNFQQSQIFQKLIDVEGFQLLRLAVQEMQQKQQFQIASQVNYQSKQEILKIPQQKLQIKKEISIQKLPEETFNKLSISQEQNKRVLNHQKSVKTIKIHKKSTKKQIKTKIATKDKTKKQRKTTKISNQSKIANQNINICNNLKSSEPVFSACAAQAKVEGQPSICEQLI